MIQPLVAICFTSVDCCGAKGFPDNSFTDVSGNEEGNARAQAITLLQEFIEKEHNQTGNEQLNDNQQADTTTNFAGVSIHSSHDVNNGLSDSDNHTKHWEQKDNIC